ncbi:hypothetical protein [Streptomyces sp. Ac-502]|uniref:hypothetical protein n=1 Tax=Streptomyces sp. Ac-502 TaxID=3342801 RepID=UPI00386245CF
MTTVDSRIAYLPQPDEFLRRARHDDELREAMAHTQRLAEDVPSSPASATRLLSNAFHAFAKAGLDYIDGDLSPVTRIAVTDQETGQDDFAAQMPAEIAELMAMALGTVTRLMLAENRAAAVKQQSAGIGDSNRPALRVVTGRAQDAADYAAAQSRRDAQDHRDDADLRSYRPTGGTS